VLLRARNILYIVYVYYIAGLDLIKSKKYSCLQTPCLQF